MLLSVPETMEDLRSMKKLWIHEILRVFYDRLVDGGDRTWLLDKVKNACNEHLHEDFNKLLAEFDDGDDGEVRTRIEASVLKSYFVFQRYAFTTSKTQR